MEKMEKIEKIENILIGDNNMATITITPTGTSDDYSIIQNAINSLGSGDTLILNGDFVTMNTVKLKSNIIWKLNGSLKLGNNVNKDLIINNGNLTNISMSGGTYDGNANGQTGSSSDGTAATYKVIYLENTTYSQFSDMLCINGGNCFSFAKSCNHNTCDRLIGRSNLKGNNADGKDLSTHGNGLGDRGDHNTWNDCIAENNYSDSFIIKCRDSIFNRCIARNSPGRVGFGIYARIDNVSPDTGEDVSRNKFYDCQAYGNAHAGFSIHIGSNCPNAIIADNYIQIVAYDNCKVSNTNGGIHFRCALSSGKIQNNEIDALVYNNKDMGGLYYNPININKITGNSGSIVAYNNTPKDIDISGSGNTYTIYHPTDKPAPIISKGLNTVTVIDFKCPDYSNIWPVSKYCGTQPSTLKTIEISPTSVSININGDKQLSAVCKDDANNVIPCPSLAWNSNNAVVTVSSSGLVTGVAIGTASVTASYGSVVSNESVITVKPLSGSIIVTNPTTGVIYKKGDSKVIKWKSIGNVGAYVKIELLRSSSIVKTISSSTRNDGQNSWTVPHVNSGSDYRIKITSKTNTQIFGTSGNFTIR